MDVEECCGALLKALLPNIDPERTGACIDVGVGTFYYYFEIFADAGFRSWAVEPLPTDEVRGRCDELNVVLVQACLSDISGEREIYVGSSHGVEVLNYSSLFDDWWGAGNRAVSVKSLRLAEFLNETKAAPITCMKLDIEGGEAMVLEQLSELPIEHRPAVIMFEYGGGATRKEGTGGWTDAFHERTISCLTSLQENGYGDFVMIDSAVGSSETLGNFQHMTDPNDLFGPSAEYGNIIACRDFPLPADAITQFCRQFLK